MKLAALLFLFLMVGAAHAQWPMTNDPAFDPSVTNPAYPDADGPRILLDNGHGNFLVQWEFIRPFAEVAKADGYRPVVDDKQFTPDYLAGFDIVLIMSALPFEFHFRLKIELSRAR